MLQVNVSAAVHSSSSSPSPSNGATSMFSTALWLKVIMENEIDFVLMPHVEEQTNISVFYFIKETLLFTPIHFHYQVLIKCFSVYSVCTVPTGTLQLS